MADIEVSGASSPHITVKNKGYNDVDNCKKCRAYETLN